MNFTTINGVSIPSGEVVKIEVNGNVLWEIPKQGITNLKDQAIFMYKQRYSLSGGVFKTNASGTAIIIPVPVGKTEITLRFKGFTKFESYPEVYGGTSTTTFTLKVGTLPVADSNGVTTTQISKSAEMSYIVFNGIGSMESDFADAIITINEPI